MFFYLTILKRQRTEKNKPICLSLFVYIYFYIYFRKEDKKEDEKAKHERLMRQRQKQIEFQHKLQQKQQDNTAVNNLGKHRITTIQSTLFQRETANKIIYQVNSFQVYQQVYIASST